MLTQAQPNQALVGSLNMIAAEHRRQRVLLPGELVWEHKGQLFALRERLGVHTSDLLRQEHGLQLCTAYKCICFDPHEARRKRNSVQIVTTPKGPLFNDLQPRR